MESNERPKEPTHGKIDETSFYDRRNSPNV